MQSLDGTIVECNTAYGGQRANTAMHYQLAKDHGYTDIADVVNSHFANYDYFVVLSHFKGHAMAGFGGAIKNAAGLSRMSGRFDDKSIGAGPMLSHLRTIFAAA